MSAQKVILLDIDGTLLDTQYRPNYPTLKNLIVRAQTEGIVFGINSNRALEDLLPVAEMFGISGPLVGENGLFVYYAAKREIKYFLNDSQLEALRKTKQEIEVKLQHLLQQKFPSSQIRWQQTDTVEEVAEHKKSSYKEGTIIAQNNKFRKYSISIYLKRYSGGELQPLMGLVPVFVSKLSAMFAKHNVTITFSPLYTNILVYSTLTSKRYATEQLIKDKYPGGSLFAIGDEMNDYYMASGIGNFLSVSNAPAPVRNKAKAVSKAPYAEGVYELISAISGKD